MIAGILFGSIILGTFLFLLYVVGIYNTIIQQHNAVKNSWSQIDVQLKRRHDLIPNLVETVRGYASHERETLDAVIQARQQAVNVEGMDAKQVAEIENQLSSCLKSLFAVSENYPNLKANENFLALQEEVSSTENRISFARQYYNDSVMKLNNSIEVFPNNIIAGMFNFKQEEFFEMAEAEKAVPKISF